MNRSTPRRIHTSFLNSAVATRNGRPVRWANLQRSIILGDGQTGRASGEVAGSAFDAAETLEQSVSDLKSHE
jgi:hypothetical protein